MTRDEARAILEAHNKWRRGDDTIPNDPPWALGRAIDVAVAELAKPAPPSDSGARRGCQHCIPPGMYQDVEGRRPAVVGDRVALVVPDDPLAKPAVVPNGWVMVPKEPTAEMIRANGQSGFDVGDKWLAEDAKQTWVAMLAAAPQPPAPSVPSVDVEAVWERIESLEYAEKWLDVFSKEAWSAAQAGKITRHRESLSTLRLELAHAIGDEK